MGVKKLVRSLSAIAALFYAFSMAVSAAEPGTDLVVSVVDAATSAPIAGAHVFLLAGYQTTMATLTDQSGTATFRRVTPASYRLIVRENRHEAFIESLDVKNDALSIFVRLASSLKQVGAVHSRSSMSLNRQILSRNNTALKVSRDLYQALSSLSGTSINTSESGGGVSLHGKDPSETSYAFNGTSITDPISSHALDPDLIESASIDQSRDLINFYFVQPSLDPNYSATATIGGFDLASVKTVVQATLGKVGIAAEYVGKGLNSSLNGSTYRDTSGLLYEHHGAFASSGNFLTLTAPLNAFAVLSGQMIQSVQHDAPISAYYDGQVPVGFGPGNSQSSSFLGRTFAVTAALPSALIKTSFSIGLSRDRQDFGNAVINLQPYPFVSRHYHNGQAISADITLLNSGLRIYAQHNHDFDSVRNVSNGVEDDFEVAQSASDISLELSRVVKPKLTLRPSLSVHIIDLFPVQFGGSAAIDWTPSERDSLTAELRLQPQDANTAFAGAFSDAAKTRYDCGAGVILASAPNDRPSPVSDLRLNIGASHRSKTTSTSVNIYQESYRGISLTSALVPAESEPAGFLPSGYLDSLRSGFGSFGNCPGAPPDSKNIFFNQSISGLSAAYRGINATAGVEIGSRVHVEGFLDLQRAVFSGSDPRLTSPRSIYIVGSQIPGVPFVRMGLSAAVAVRPGLQLMANSLFVSGNNDRNLPPYLQLNLGIERQLSPNLTLDIVATNVGREDVDLFTSHRFAVPQVTQGGARYLPYAAPLAQPDIFARINAHFGGGAP